MVKKATIYTKAGDLGETSLPGGFKVRKSDLIIKAVGSIDELNAIIGLSAVFIKEPKLRKFFFEIQNQLFGIGATLVQQKDRKFEQIEGVDVERFEKLIDQLDSKIPTLKNFILPGGTLESSLLHYARTICRRTERIVVELSEKQKINSLITKYLNRLSDFLFVTARYLNKKQGKKETIWKRK